MTRAPALLLVQLQPPPELTGEFHDWYDTEHVPERARIPGFLTTVRLVCPNGWPSSWPGTCRADGHESSGASRRPHPRPPSSSTRPRWT
jgi:hypothetical protein